MKPLRAIARMCVLLLLDDIAAYAGAPSEQQLMWNETWTDRLKRELFVKYDKFARPTQHYNTTVVSMDLYVLHASVDEFKSTMYVNGWVWQIWTDEKLKWEPSKYGGLQEIHVGNHEIWQPDVTLYNSATANTIEHYGDSHCIINHDGTVLWVPPAQFVAFCNLDLRLWPFDTQLCTLTMGSWTFHGRQIDLQLKSPAMQQGTYVKNTEWQILNLSRSREEVMYACCPEAYIQLNFTLTLKRNSGLYYNVLMTPAAAVVFLMLTIFWLSPQSEMKFTIAACTILIIALFLMYFGLKVPLTTCPPLLVHFYSGCLCQVTITLILSVFVINTAKRPCCKPLPRNIRLLLLNWPGKLLGLSDLIAVIESRRPMPGQELRGKMTEESAANSTSNISDDCDRQNIISPSKNSTQLEWVLAGTALDRIAFLLFCVILTTMAIFFLS
ncbi:hypothetical protein KM043_000306 [Ampulex compressa]|nr:hypothetical protein KM043_000306 [Ampulex compressa]